MAKKKVALVLSGGVSLGAYIAGALDELLRALNTAADRYEIDVITGASAGATTGALIAHGLLYRGGENELFSTWVEKIDMLELLTPHFAADEPVSLLSNQVLRRLAQQALTMPAAPRPAACCAPLLTVAMTLTNSQALPYVSRIKMPNAADAADFVQYRHSEQEAFHFTPTNPPDPNTLKRFGEVAIASAAFPFVFPMVRLHRTTTKPEHYIHQPAFSGESDFLYYDGGTFNNLPIDLAWHYAGFSSADNNDRMILMVDPSRNDVYEPNRNPPYPDLLRYGQDLLGALQRESSANQFENEVQSRNRPGVSFVIPGVDQAPVEVLQNMALVIPKRGAPRLRGSYLFVALSAFLDRRFREYDFRRGAADAREVAQSVLEIKNYASGRPDGFYQPDDDPALRQEIDSYDDLERIKSLRDPGRSLRQVFESALDTRIKAIVDRIDPPGPDAIYAWVANNLIKRRLPDVWAG